MDWLSMDTLALGKATEEPNVDEQYQISVRLSWRRTLWLVSEVVFDDEDPRESGPSILGALGRLSYKVAICGGRKRCSQGPRRKIQRISLFVLVAHKESFV